MEIEAVPQDSHKKLWIIIIIAAIVLILMIAGIFVKSIMKKRGIQKTNINIMKQMKCISSCPYEKFDQISFPVQECFYSCSEIYNFSREITEKYYEHLVNFTECNEKLEEENEFRNCVNRKLEEYSSIIDLSNEDIKADYEIIDIKIEQLSCANDSAIIKVKSNADNLDEISFLIYGDEDVITKKEEPPLKGELKAYILEEFPFIPKEIKMIIVKNEKNILKDVKYC